MLNLVLLGPPGSGKGTQSTKLVGKYGFLCLTIGDLLRNEVEVGTELGQKIDRFLTSGDLIPDDIIKTLFELKICQTNCKNNFLFDGLPRTYDQALWLQVQLAKVNMAVDLVLELKVEKAEILKRIVRRSKYSGRVDDQNEDVIKHRINIYNNEVRSIKEHYECIGVLVEIDGLGSELEVFRRICSVVDNKITQFVRLVL